MIRVDKNCVSCSGYAPQILSQIKAACLSYVNSPIEFGKEKLDYSDLISVKDMILKKCELIMAGMEEITSVHSVFGFLGDDSVPRERQRHTMNANINIHNSIMEEDGGPYNHGNSSKHLEIKSPDSFEYNLDTSIQRTDLFADQNKTATILKPPTQGRRSPVTKTEITSQGGFIAMKELEKNLSP